MNTVEQMKDEIRTALINGEELDSIRDNLGEWVDGYIPIYYNHLMKEWAEMPSQYNDRGYEELGGGGEVTIFKLMTLDLYLYYTDLFYEALNEVETELGDVA